MSGLILMRPAQAFTPYVPKPLPQGATGDLDGDGRPDDARIQHPDDGLAHISVRLSGSSASVRLDATVDALIDGDIDHDGDLDLVATTASGDVLIWLNDGHGRFTRRERSETRGFAGGPVATNTEWTDPIVVGVAAPFITSGNRAETYVVVAQIRPPTAPLAFDLNFLLLQTLRAPPGFSVQHFARS